MEELTHVALSDATPEMLEQFTDLLHEQVSSEELQKHHTCWLFVPTAAEYARMSKFSTSPDYDKCPKCGRGRVVLEIHSGNIGQSLTLVCKWGDPTCGFSEYISDDE